MNDNVSAALGGARSGLGGLPQRLVQDGVVEEAAVLEALNTSRERNVTLVTQLVESGAAQARDISVAASNEFGVPLLDLDALTLDPETVGLVSDKLVAKHRVLPLFRRGKKLFLGVADPTHLHAIDEIKFQTSLSIEVVVVDDDKLQATIDKAIEQADNRISALTGEGDMDLDSLEVSGGEEQAEERIGRDDVEDAPIVRFVNKVMVDAIRRGASDIHFEPYEKIYRVRLRMDGILKEIAQPPVQLGGKLAARLKVMARLDIAERRMPQDGRIKMKLSKNRAIDFRVSTCPTLFGEKVVMRILDPSQAMLGIDSLGYEPFQKVLYEQHLEKPQGMILVTGPTGSGKTVSLYTGLNILNREGNNISTAEDPAEINLPGVNQVNINPKVGLTFAAAMRAFLRQDPDIIMLGEMRDAATFTAAMSAADTGHLVFSTLHTTTASQSITRILDFFKADEREQIRRQLAGTLRGVICQRMVPTVDGKMTPALEIMINSPVVRKMIEENRLDKLSAAVETGADDGMITFNQCLFNLVKAGRITQKEAMAKASNPQALEMNFKGIFLNEGGRIVG